MALKRRIAVEDLGRRLTQRRAELGLTEQEVADRVGVTVRGAQRWFYGEAVPQDRNIYKLAEALEMDPSELLIDLVPAAEAVPNHGQLDRIEAELGAVRRQLEQALTLLSRQTTRASARRAAKARQAKPRKKAAGP